jgi:hypothetical protein
MANDMAIKNNFSHTDSLGRNPFQRMDALGYDYNTWKGENLAAGTDDPQAVFDQWRNSALHNENLLKPEYIAVGLAGGYSESSTYKWYWALELGGYLEGSGPTDDGLSTDSLHLVEGWNNLSYLGSSAPPDQALSSIAGKYVVVYYWDAAEKEWLSYSPDVPSVLNDLTLMETYRAYWIYAAQEVTFVFR